MTDALAAAPPRRLAIEPLTERSALLTWSAIFCLALVPLSVIGGLVDPRTINGVSTWLKPLKFQLSVGVYLLTFAWFYGYVTTRARRGWAGQAIAWTAAGTGLFEVVYITLQGARGLPSHFNYSSPFYETMYGLMGIGATFLTLASVALALLIGRRGTLERGLFRTSVLAGLVLTGALGVFTGFQIASNGGHWVGGVHDDAGGLPLFSWVRDGGDLRVAHFFGMHALQIVPLAAAAMLAAGARSRAWALLPAGSVTALVLWTSLEARAGAPFLPFLTP